jgi:hypothetical protein
LFRFEIEMIGCIFQMLSQPKRALAAACLHFPHACHASRAKPASGHECRWPLRAAECRRGSVDVGGVAFGLGLQISYLNSRPQSVQFQTAKSSCFTVGAVSKSWSQSASPELARTECGR